MAILDERGEGFIFAHVLMPTENAHLVQCAFEKLYELEPEACLQVRVLISDITSVFVNGWQGAIPESQATIIKCSWHIEKGIHKPSSQRQIWG